MFRHGVRLCVPSASASGHKPLSYTSQKRIMERKIKVDAAIVHKLAEKRIGKPVTTADRRRVWFELNQKKYAPVFLNQIKPRMTLWAKALKEEELPPAKLPEIALAGRSNSGKSTLVNYLSGRAAADIRRIPGSTRELTFWKLGKPNTLCMVDLPGYGFAEAPNETRTQWTEFTLWYLQRRKNLRCVILLVDARHGLMVSDHEMINFLERHKVSYQIVLSKCDKVKQRELARRITYTNKHDLKNYAHMIGPPIPISALKKQNLDALRTVINQYAKPKEMVVDGIKKRVYDLLEQRRLTLQEKRKRKKDKLKNKEEDTDDKDQTAYTVLNSWGVGVFQGGFWQIDDRDSLRVKGFIDAMWGSDTPILPRQPKKPALFPDFAIEEEEEEPVAPSPSADPFADDPFVMSFDLSAAPATSKEESPEDSGRKGGKRKNVDFIVDEDDMVSQEEKEWAVRQGKHFDESEGSMHERMKYLFHRQKRTALDGGSEDMEDVAAPAEKVKKTVREAPPLPIGRRTRGRPVPKGIQKWKVLGKPRLKVPRVRYKPDVATLIGAPGEGKAGKSYDWQEASRKWLVWARRSKKVGRGDEVRRGKLSKEQVIERGKKRGAQRGGADADYFKNERD